MPFTAEQTKCRKLVDRIVAAGYKISVNDGEEWVIKKSTNATEIKGVLFSTDQDVLKIRDTEGLMVGTIWLVYGNSAEEVIADHSDTETIRKLVGE